MTTKAEDKFYFGSNNIQAEYDALVRKDRKSLVEMWLRITTDSRPTRDREKDEMAWEILANKYGESAVDSNLHKRVNFDLSEACWDGYEAVGTKRKDGRTVPNCVPKSKNAKPDRFEASSINREGAEAASRSPILGALLDKNVMPSGGWRAVDTGSGVLVVDFEDQDIAEGFRKGAVRAGFTSTNPQITAGRYWKVEVQQAQGKTMAKRIKAEDKFYFQGRGTKAKFGNIEDWSNETITLKQLQQAIVVAMNQAINTSNAALNKKAAYPYRNIIGLLDLVAPRIQQMQSIVGKLDGLHREMKFSRPGKKAI